MADVDPVWDQSSDGSSSAASGSDASGSSNGAGGLDVPAASAALVQVQ